MSFSLNNKDDQFNEMLRVALQVERPWELTKVEFDEKHKEWHLYFDFERGSVFPCPIGCGHNGCTVYDSDWKTWRHLDFWEWKTYMHARVPRVDCKLCEKATTVRVPWSRPESHFTLQFDSSAMRLMSEMSVNAAARELREHDTRMW